MRATGVTRRLDDLGRVVVPKEIRNHFGINNGDPVEFYVDEFGVYIKKYEPGCTFCGNALKISNYKGRNICQACASEIADGLAKVG